MVWIAFPLEPSETGLGQATGLHGAWSWPWEATLRAVHIPDKCCGAGEGVHANKGRFRPLACF